ncbi:hypothetical protein CJ481_17515 [Bacillus subtilis]|nr:hypothetical protein CJ481_17515 [Bacillus subtilis]
MAYKKKDDIKINKKHGGKEFTNNFRFVGLVKPVRKKDPETDSWYDAEIFETTVTQTKKNRRVLQFNIETAPYNELKVELSGMERDLVYAYSSVHKKTVPLPWADRNDKTKLPDETYHVITPEWDVTEQLAKIVKPGMWVEVQGQYEFDSFENNNGEEIKLVKRIIKRVYPLKNGEVEIKGVKDGDQFKVYDSEEDGIWLGSGKAKEGVAKVKVGWLNPDGGDLFITKITDDGEGKRFKVSYTDDVVETDKIKVSNNIQSEVRVVEADGKYNYVSYVRDFASEDFKEHNKFEMQLGIKSTYQDEETKDTKVNGVYLDHGKEKSVPKDVELIVYYKEPEEGKKPFADAFVGLKRGDFLVVEGIDNNRAQFTQVQVAESEEENPFEDVGEKVASFETVSTGTRKGLEVLRYIGGTWKSEFLSEEEISNEKKPNEDPFAEVTVDDDDLPF